MCVCVCVCVVASYVSEVMQPKVSRALHTDSVLVESWANGETIARYPIQFNTRVPSNTFTLIRSWFELGLRGKRILDLGLG